MSDIGGFRLGSIRRGFGSFGFRFGLQQVTARLSLTRTRLRGSVIQLEVFLNNVEDKRLRETSGDMYYIRGRYLRRLIDLLDEGGWKKMNAGVQGHPNSKDFNPEVL